jgi:hypothetical protein
MAPFVGDESTGTPGATAVVKLHKDDADEVPPGPVAVTFQ